MDTKTLVARYIESVWNQADPETLAALTTDDFAYALGGQPPLDRAGMAAFLAAMRAAFSDWRVEITEITGDGDLAAARWRGRVTHDGPFHGIPATGRPIDVSGINMYRVRDGRIAREWEQTDSLGMLRQMGVLPG
ncbi:MAG TPA: ester cyclase [Candidatus Krumholzibacteria bacterium]|mgnify:CR=1 FL=1|nr:ester cyclase [Candidatus Krumholzibacteria bacterium]HRX50963.1 ester cyclase [Candidatus Krumholzibacteria bacterium]